MKKRFLAIGVIMLIFSSLVGCRNEEEASTEPDHEANATAEEEETITSIAEINIGVIQGPSAMGMVGLMDEMDNGLITDVIYHFTLAGSPDEVIPALVQGDFHIAALPPNLASVLYNNTDGEIQVIAINTLGVLHIVTALEEITGVEDLRGRTIYASGAGGTPEFVLNYILEGNGIDPQNDVFIQWLAEHTEVATRLGMSEDGIGMLPQPFVTVAMTQNEALRLALDLTEEWEHVQANTEGPRSALIMGVLVARREFITQYPEAVGVFLDHFASSVQFVNANTSEAAQLIEYYDIFPAPIATNALPHSNITFIAATEMKELFSGFLHVLYAQNPESIGGEMPSDEFYYIHQ